MKDEMKDIKMEYDSAMQERHERVVIERLPKRMATLMLFWEWRRLRDRNRLRLES